MQIPFTSSALSIERFFCKWRECHQPSDGLEIRIRDWDAKRLLFLYFSRVYCHFMVCSRSFLSPNSFLKLPRILLILFFLPYPPKKSFEMMMMLDNFFWSLSFPSTLLTNGFNLHWLRTDHSCSGGGQEKKKVCSCVLNELGPCVTLVRQKGALTKCVKYIEKCALASWKSSVHALHKVLQIGALTKCVKSLKMRHWQIYIFDQVD